MRYDNIEIGTSDYATQIQSAAGNGISVEPVKAYFDRLPDRKGWHKVNAAISDHPGEVDVYYVDPEKTDGLPMWVRGCNMIDTPHPTIEERYPGLLQQTTTQCMTMKQLLDRFDVTEVGFLKIDTEGHDYRIIKDYFDTGLPIPDKLMYESNELMSTKHKAELRHLLKQHYMIIREKRFNTICKR